MGKDLHVFTGGLDPFEFRVGDIMVHVHAGSPGEESAGPAPDGPETSSGGRVIWKPTGPGCDAITGPPSDDFRALFEEHAGRASDVHLMVQGDWAGGEPAQLLPVLTGLSEADANYLNVYLSAEGAEGSG